MGLAWGDESLSPLGWGPGSSCPAPCTDTTQTGCTLSAPALRQARARLWSCAQVPSGVGRGPRREARGMGVNVSEGSREEEELGTGLGCARWQRSRSGLLPRAGGRGAARDIAVAPSLFSEAERGRKETSRAGAEME